MKLLLTSNGITNDSISRALEELLGKPISEASALFVPTAIYPFPSGGRYVMRALSTASTAPLRAGEWKSFGLLELTALPSIQRESWVPLLEETDALLVWGGHVAYLRYWMQRSGVADLLPTLKNLVYVGVSAGSIVMTPYNCDVESNREFAPSSGEFAVTDDRALGFVEFTMWVHVGNPDPIFADHTIANVQRWATSVPVPTYAIDDDTAIKVNGDAIDVVSEGRWEIFRP